MNQSFKDKVRSMTGKEIVMAMVNGLLHEHYEVSMTSFGHTNNGICYGCAATHCITEISGIKFGRDIIRMREDRAIAINVDYEFLHIFEDVIDDLRTGRIDAYNSKVEAIGIVKLNSPSKPLPYLKTSTWKYDIQDYIDYANTLS